MTNDVEGYRPVHEKAAEGLRALGTTTEIPDKPRFSTLEAIPFNTREGLVVRLTCPEFTSLCPKTGQPDFAHLVIDYAPNEFLVESKSLKLHLFSFRNHGAFHESCTRHIYDDLRTLLSPFWIRVAAFWYPRGGIPIDVVIESGELGRWKPLPLDVPAYRGRG